MVHSQRHQPDVLFEVLVYEFGSRVGVLVPETATLNSVRTLLESKYSNKDYNKQKQPNDESTHQQQASDVPEKRP